MEWACPLTPTPLSKITLHSMRIFRNLFRHGGELLLIILAALAIREGFTRGLLSQRAACWAVVIGAALKSIWFVMENLTELLRASAKDLPYHRVLVLMLLNMAQIMLSFGLDYWVLQSVDANSLSAINPNFSQPELIFECIYFSVLDFSFFGYGDITPQTIPAKLVTMMEVCLAFFTMIFLLSDFISLKDSLKNKN